LGQDALDLDFAFLASLALCFGHRLLNLCAAAVRKGDKTEIRQAMEICFALLHHIDEGRDDILFFADEGGRWQAAVDWCLTLTMMTSKTLSWME
jgi:hypothetical protein